MEQKQICWGRSSSVISDSLQLHSSGYPWLVSSMFTEEGRDQIFSTSANEHYHCQIPELVGRKIEGCFHGWLILFKFSPSPVEFSLWNPVTQEVINLPPLKLEDNILSYFLSSPPNPDSVVLLGRNSKPNFVFCLLRSETKTWTEISYAQQIRNLYISDDEFEEDDHFIFTPVCCNNKVYAITNYRKVIQIDILDNQINLFRCSEIPDVGSDIYDSYLVGSCTDLFTINVWFKENPSKEIQFIQLFKLDFGTMTWEEMKSSKDRAFFLVDSIYSQISCPAIESHSGSYVHIIQDMCKVYSYNMEDKTISLSYLCCPDIQPALCQHHISLWILPESRISDEAKSITDIKEQGKGKEEMVVRSIVSDERMMNEQKLGEEMKSHFLDIPFHILELIAEYCVAVEYLNLRATCKHFQLAAPSKQWSTATALGRLQTHSLVSPWLVVIDKLQGIITLKDPKLGGKYFMTTSPELIGDAVIGSSRYGWLLIFAGLERPHFFNPLTRAIVRLPNLVLACYSSFAFSAPPTSPDCIVVVGLTGTIHLISPGQPEWRTVFIDPNIRSDLLSSHKSLAFCGPNLYFFSSQGKLGVFRTGAYNCEFLVHGPPETCSTSCGQRFLVECNNNLVSIVVGELGKWVEVFKLNHSTLQWERVNSLGKHMIYICGTESFSAVAKISGMENKIYFPRFYGGKMVFYCLDTCRYQTFGDINGKDKKEAFRDFSPTIEQLSSAWIEPSWSVKHVSTLA